MPKQPKEGNLGRFQRTKSPIKNASLHQTPGERERQFVLYICEALFFIEELYILASIDKGPFLTAVRLRIQLPIWARVAVLNLPRQSHIWL